MTEEFEKWMSDWCARNPNPATVLQEQTVWAAAWQASRKQALEEAHEPDLLAVAGLLFRHAGVVMEWEPIETAPHDGTPVLLFARAVNARAPIRIVGWWATGLGWIEAAFGPNRPVGLAPLYWMPLPEIPNVVKKQA